MRKRSSSNCRRRSSTSARSCVCGHTQRAHEYRAHDDRGCVECSCDLKPYEIQQGGYWVYDRLGAPHTWVTNADHYSGLAGTAGAGESR